MKRYANDLKQLLGCRSLVIAVLIMIIVGYGFSLVHTTISIDDMEQDRYFETEKIMIANGRFGGAIWDALATRQMTLQQSDLFAVFLLAWAALSYCVLFRRIAGEHISIFACGIFSCIFLCYPLINEIWEYTAAALAVSGGFLLASFALLLVHSYLHASDKKAHLLITAVLLMMWVFACYESLVSVYVFFVFAVLGMQMIWGSEREKRLSTAIRQGLVYAAVVFAGIALRLVIHKLIIEYTSLHTDMSGETEIYWLSQGIPTTLRNLTKDFQERILLHGIIYFPLTELLVGIALFIGLGIPLCRKYGCILLLPGFGMLLSLFLLPLVQGFMVNYRTFQVFEPFVAFVGMMLAICVESHPFQRAKWLPRAAQILLCWLCLYQSIYLNYFLTLNHLRFEEEIHVVHTVGTQLQAEYDLEKPVIFVGEYQLSESIRERSSVQKYSLPWKIYAKAHGLYRRSQGFLRYDPEILERKLPQSNVNTVLAWSVYGFEQDAMQKLFAYLGFEYKQANYQQYLHKGIAYVQEHQIPAYPKKGYISDCGDFIVVCMGPL